jgi:hypothetical protein
MGQTTSAHVTSGNNQRDSVLSDYQISTAIESMFKSPNTTKYDSVRIERSANMLETSPVEVDTIVNGMKGGNRTRLSIVPLRKRYKEDSGQKDQTGGGDTNNLTSDDLRFVRNVVYQNDQDLNNSGNAEFSKPIFQHIKSTDYTSNINNGMFSATSVDSVSGGSGYSNTFSPTSAEPVSDRNMNFSPTSAEPVSDRHMTFSPTSAEPLSDRNVNFSATSVNNSVEAGLNNFSPTSAEPVSEKHEVFSATSVDNVHSDSKTGGKNIYSIDKEINTIKNFINNTLKQRGGDNTNANVEQNNKVDTSKQISGRPTFDILSEEGLAEIRDNLARHGINGKNNMAPNGDTNNAPQKGGKFDAELRTFRDNILNNSKSNDHENYSATSPDPSRSLWDLKGGKPSKKDDDDKDNEKNKKKDDEENEDDDNDDNDDNDEDDEDDDDEDEDDEDDDEDEEGEEGEEESLGVQSGASKNKSNDKAQKQDQAQETPQDRRKKLSKDDSSSSNSSSESEDSSSSDSSSEITDAAVAVMHYSIDKAMDKRNNRSKYLKNNGYNVTSNSERDYKIKNNITYSSDVHNSVGGSDYLNTMRNRDRSG